MCLLLEVPVFGGGNQKENRHVGRGQPPRLQLLHNRGVALMDEPGGRGKGAEAAGSVACVSSAVEGKACGVCVWCVCVCVRG